MKQNSIEWLYDQMSNLAAGYATELNQQEILEKAKAMHKAETCQFAVNWFKDCPIGGDVNSTEEATQYYNDTFNK